MKARFLFLPLALLLSAFAVGCSEDGDTIIIQEADGAPGDAEPTTAVEACLGCHGPDGAVPVASITDPRDAHFIAEETDAPPPVPPLNLQRLVVTITSVDVSGSSVVIEFDVEDEDGAPVTEIFAGDGRFTIAELLLPTAPELDGLRFPYGDGASPQWRPYLTRTESPGDVGDGDGSSETQATAEGFSSGTFDNLGGGSYRYTSSFDPTSVPVESGDTIRVAIQLSAGDLPAGNGWCDFDASLVGPSSCGSNSRTRDIVQTAVCNECHGATFDTKLALHGGGRTDVEYCVTCHNPFSTDANSDNLVSMTSMIHKIHFGSRLSKDYKIWGFRNSLHDYSHVTFTKTIEDCTTCHRGGGVDQQHWNQFPTFEACESCHDDVDVSAGDGHIQITENSFCNNCHVPGMPGVAGDPGEIPIRTVHWGAEQRMEADQYTGPGNGFDIISTDFDDGDLTIEFSVTRDGTLMDLDDDPEWTAPFGASRLAIIVGWSTTDYTNEGGSEPALPISVDARDVLDPVDNPDGVVTELPGPVYRTTVSLPSEASGTVTVAMEGHPAASLVGTGGFERIPVLNVFEHVNIESRGPAEPRRMVVDVTRCNDCHGAAGQGISLHGNNRTGEPIVCAVCHNPNNTDIEVRPADPMDAVDGLREHTIDFKRMVHQIHNGAELEDGIVIYGFMGSVNDFSHVEFIGNLQNCETCHMPGTYGAENAAGANVFGDPLPTTIDTGDDLADPSDDLNISPIASVCSACHDDDAATDHMKLHGGAFSLLDENIE